MPGTKAYHELTRARTVRFVPSQLNIVLVFENARSLASLVMTGLRLGDYCSRKTVPGSTLPARHAGTNAAATPTASNVRLAAANEIGSIALT